MKKKNSELDYFSQLSSNNKPSRIQGTRGIMKRIKSNSKTSPHVVYLICKRLIRGLGGSNPKFRQGCFTSVVGFLKLLPEKFDLKLIESIIEDELNPSGSESKLEEGEAYLGKILAYGAMIVTGHILNKSEEDQIRVFDIIFQLGKKRSYLHHASFLFLNMMLKKASKEFKPEGFIDHLNDLDNYTLDKLNYLVTLSDLSLKTHTIKKIFGNKRLYDLNNVKAISDLLKQNKSPKLLNHEFYNNFVESVWNQPQFLMSFWNSLCESKLSNDGVRFKADKSSCAQDSFVLQVAAKLFNKCLSGKDGQLAIQLFNDSLINLLINNSKTNKKIVQSLLHDFYMSVKLLDDNAKLNFLKQMLFDKGLLNFDTMTGSKTIISITNSLSFKGISSLADLYKEVLEFKRSVLISESKNKGFIVCLSYFTKLVNSSPCYEETSWRLSQLLYLLKMGYFTANDKKINRELRQQLQEAFLTSIGHRFPSLDSFLKVLEGLVSEINSLLKVGDPVAKFTDEMTDVLKMSIKLSKRMNKHLENDSENKEVILVLKIILQYMVILLLKESKTAIANIQDLQNIFEDLVGDKNEKVWIEVLIDMFLNLLSKPYYHHRHLIRSTFKAVCPQLTLKAFLQIVEVLSPSYNSEEMEEEDEENESDIDSDNSAPESQGEEMDKEEEDDEDDDEEITANEKLRMELRNALGGGASDNESVDLDDMDEEEGKKLDETLSNIFRANYKKKRSNNLSKYENQLAHFRTRVMDIIEMSTEVLLPLSYWLKVLLPLIDLLGSTVGQAKLECLRKRITCCIKKLNASKVVHDETAEGDVQNIVENILERMKSSGIFSDVKNELALVIKFLLKSSKSLIKGLKEKQLDKNLIFLCYKKYLDGFLQGENNLPMQLFTGVISIGWDGMLPLLPSIIKNSFDTNIKTHRRLSGFKLIETFVKTPQFFDGHLENYYDSYLPRMRDLFNEGIEKEVQNILESKDINMKYYFELWSLLNCIVGRQTSSQLPPILDVEGITKLIESSLTSLPSMKNKCRQQFKKLCTTLSINISKEVCVDSKESEKHSKNSLERKRKGDPIIKKKKIKRLSSNTTIQTE